MKRCMTRSHKGFTLLEILLVVAIISILAGIVIVAINPARQLGSTRDAQRKSDIGTIYKAVNQYLIDNGHYPTTITTTLTPICDPAKSCTGIDLSSLVPVYLSAIPKDANATTDSGYEIAKVGTNVYLEAPDTEVGFLNQPGYSTTTPVAAFVGTFPSGYTPTVASQGSTGGSGGSGGSQQATSHALQFDGSQNYVSVPYSSSFYSSPFTVEAWINPTSMSDYKFIINTRNATSGGGGYHLARWSDGKIWFYSDGIGGWYQGSTVVPDGSWSHVAVTYNGTTLKIWVNGVEDFSVDATGSISDSGNPLYIGTDISNSHNFEGIIDEVRISNTVRYTSTFTPSTSFSSDGNTVALWKFNEGSGTTAADSSSNGHTGTLEGSPTPSWVTEK